MFTRRALLGAGLAATLVSATACGSATEAPGIGCRTPEALASFDTLAGARLNYEGSRATRSFQADPAFIAQLEAWASSWVSAAGLGPLLSVSTYGAYVIKCPSWHAAGRAFDIAGLVHEGGSVSCRYDVWGDDEPRLRNYWRLAASLSTAFTYTLGYPFNEQHHNHLHIDNGVNGDAETRFDPRSRAQTHIVQGVLRHVFGTPTDLTGDFDDATRSAVAAVTRERGLDADLTSPDGWKAFLDAAATA